MAEDRDIVKEIKEKLRIEDVVAADGFSLPDHGRYRKAPHSNGLVVDTRNQSYHWNGPGTYGDVIQWVMDQKKCDFKEAVATLAQRAGLPAPAWDRADSAARVATRARESALAVAAKVFQGWFWVSAEAQEYAHGRGWSLVVPVAGGSVDEKTSGRRDPAPKRKPGASDAEQIAKNRTIYPFSKDAIADMEVGKEYMDRWMQERISKIIPPGSATAATGNGTEPVDWDEEVEDPVSGERVTRRELLSRAKVSWAADPATATPSKEEGGETQAELKAGVESGGTGFSRFEGTCWRAGLGFSGRGSSQEREEMRAAMISSGVDVESPAAVAILGYSGDVQKWAKKHGVSEVNEDWVIGGRILGMIGRSMIVYPHREAGRVVYLSCRGIQGHSFHNLPKELVGPKRVYYNHEYASGERALVIVEGQADAISLAQWDIPALAIAGASMDVDLALMLQGRHQVIYYCADMDVTGITAAWRVMALFGPMARVITARNTLGAQWLVEEGMPDVQKAQVERANSLAMALARVTTWPIHAKYGEIGNREAATSDDGVGAAQDVAMRESKRT